MKNSLLAGAAVAVTLAVLVVFVMTWGDSFPPPEDSAPDAQSASRRAIAPDLPRIPGEFEPQDALVISAAQMVQFHPRLMQDLVAALEPHIGLICLVGGDGERELVTRRLDAAGLPPGTVDFIDSPMMTMWVRDWGPIAIERPGGDLKLIDPHYEGNSRNPGDDRAGADMAADLGLPVRDLPLTLEGGDILGNGRGLGLTSRRMVQRNERGRGYDTAEIAGLLRSHLGIEDWFPLPSLVGEPTGHIDMFATFVDSLTVVVGRYDRQTDPTNAALLDKVAAALDGFVTRAGTLRVERVTMPDRPDAAWRSYTNVVYANGAVLVPQYPDHSPALDEAALALYRRLLPEREIVGIDCSDLIRRNGALHCVTLNLPEGARPDSTTS